MEFTWNLLEVPGYPCRKHWMTPHRYVKTDSERAFNRSIRRSRQIIEHAFVLWRDRFSALQALQK